MEDNEREVESVQSSEIDIPPGDEVSNSSVSSENEIILPALQTLPLFIEPNDKIAKEYYHNPNQNNPFPLESSNNSSSGMMIRNRISVPVSGREEEEKVNDQINNRKAFNKKAFGLLCLQLTWTFIFIWIVAGNTKLQNGMKRFIKLVILAMIINLLLITLSTILRGCVRKYPQNYIIMFLLCSVKSYILALISCYSDPDVFLGLVLIALAAPASLTLYEFLAKSKFHIYKGLLFSVTANLIMYGLLMIFFYQKYFPLLFCMIGMIPYSWFISNFTWRIAEGEYKVIQPDDYVWYALVLYPDPILILIYTLSRLRKTDGCCCLIL